VSDDPSLPLELASATVADYLWSAAIGAAAAGVVLAVPLLNRWRMRRYAARVDARRRRGHDSYFEEARSLAAYPPEGPTTIGIAWMLLAVLLGLAAALIVLAGRLHEKPLARATVLSAMLIMAASELVSILRRTRLASYAGLAVPDADRLPLWRLLQPIVIWGLIASPIFLDLPKTLEALF
jgi:hypothetical protein